MSQDANDKICAQDAKAAPESGVIPSEIQPTSAQPAPQQDEDKYDKFTVTRKKIITATVSLGGLTATMASLPVLSAIPEIASAFDTTGKIINLSNGLYMLFMGISTLLWGPLSEVYGRKWTAITSAGLFLAFSIGTALSHNLVAFYVFRMLSALTGSSFLAIGSSCIADIYKPIERATALGWFIAGGLIGPSCGPFVGSIIVTYRGWRAIFWFQSVLGGILTVFVILFLPETSHRVRFHEMRDLGFADQAKQVWKHANPFNVIALFRYPKILIIGIAASSLVWNMQCLLSPVRYVINPRFNLTSPLVSGLFFLAPGAGYVAGTFIGGRWADHTVKKWIKIRGKRIPEDRLRSSLIAMGFVTPGSMLIYGWAIEKEKGGAALPVICMFAQGVSQVVCFPSLATYCLDVFEGKGAKVIAGNYFIRYVIGAVGTAVCLPGIQGIGVGWFNTVTAVFVAVSCVGVYSLVRMEPRLNAVNLEDGVRREDEKA
ncbi:hypothetical protein NM208_g644 [Fusarium decemcellulare]|uniref:Uncharacterized protein n=1 Tax=Fusarium decemcellulare TaxID=57161 RepID=A0ACC1SYY2_9HYPO|nr:hypothetical protein NM208_g644 [Fusarium decemcellulare]